ncbi:hypothetical protein RvY_00989 [Ramazzottius varieornatus]|uniref:Dynein heavy chain tail domain-containing protein n=1 Tax=Ramazzottius varieornatus TaxID=947166 RepID=A0A1D1UIB8_RAMVA|nr:hypothetical protein RvY_00989 [Ramazzottius varieornatus]
MESEDGQRKLSAPLYKFLCRRLSVGFGIPHETAESLLAASKEVLVAFDEFVKADGKQVLFVIFHRSDATSGTGYFTTHEMDTDAVHQDTIYLLKINKHTTLTDKNIQEETSFGVLNTSKYSGVCACLSDKLSRIKSVLAAWENSIQSDDYLLSTERSPFFLRLMDETIASFRETEQAVVESSALSLADWLPQERKHVNVEERIRVGSIGTVYNTVTHTLREIANINAQAFDNAVFLGNKPDGRGSDIMEEVFVWRSAVIKFYRILHMLRSEPFQQAMTVFIKNEDDEEKRQQTQELWSKLVTRTSDVFGDVRKIYAKLLECADKFYVLFHPNMKQVNENLPALISWICTTEFSSKNFGDRWRSSALVKLSSMLMKRIYLALTPPGQEHLFDKDYLQAVDLLRDCDGAIQTYLQHAANHGSLAYSNHNFDQLRLLGIRIKKIARIFQHFMEYFKWWNLHVFGMDQSLFHMEHAFTLFKQRLQEMFNIDSPAFENDCRDFTKFFLRCSGEAAAAYANVLKSSDSTSELLELGTKLRLLSKQQQDILRQYWDSSETVKGSQDETAALVGKPLLVLPTIFSVVLPYNRQNHFG